MDRDEYRSHQQKYEEIRRKKLEEIELKRKEEIENARVRSLNVSKTKLRTKAYIEVEERRRFEQEQQ